MRPRELAAFSACPRCHLVAAHTIGHPRQMWDAGGEYKAFERECRACGQSWYEAIAVTQEARP